MADAHLEIAQVAADTDTGPQALSIPDLSGATPKASLLLMAKGITPGTAADEYNFSIGGTDGTNQVQTSANSEHAQSTADCTRQYQTDEVISMLDEGVTSSINEAAHSSFGADTHNINWANAPEAAFLINILAIAGADAKVAVGTIDTNTTQNGTATVSGLAFQPDLVFFWHANLDSPAGSSGSQRGMGWAVDNASTIQQACWAFMCDNGSPSGDPASFVSASRCSAEITEGDAIDWTIELTSFETDGFVLTTRDGDGNAEHGYLAVELANTKVWAGMVDSPIATGDWSITAPGFQPQFVMLGLAYGTVDGTVATGAAGGVCGVSMFTPDSEVCVACAEEDIADPTDSQSMQDTKAINLPEDDGSTGFVATWVEMLSTGWKLNFSAENVTTAVKWPALAVEDTNIPAAGINIIVPVA